MDDFVAGDRVCPGVSNHRLVQLRALLVCWLVAGRSHAACGYEQRVHPSIGLVAEVAVRMVAKRGPPFAGRDVLTNE